MRTPHTNPPVQLLRPAVIEFRFNNEETYSQQLDIFKNALKPEGVVSTSNSCYFPIMVNPAGEGRDMELRFVLLKNAQHGNTRTIVYWQVPDSDLSSASGVLVKDHGFKVLEPIQPQPIDGSTQTLLSHASEDSSALTASADRVLALVVNPPYPFSRLSAAASAGREAESRPNYLVWAGCSVALLLGFMAGWVSKK